MLCCVEGGASALTPSLCHSCALPPLLNASGKPAAEIAAAPCSLSLLLPSLQLLKLVINEARPSDRKADPGMPSAHGNSLGFLVRPLFVGGRGGLCA